MSDASETISVSVIRGHVLCSHIVFIHKAHICPSLDRMESSGQSQMLIDILFERRPCGEQLVSPLNSCCLLAHPYVVFWVRSYVLLCLWLGTLNGLENIKLSGYNRISVTSLSNSACSLSLPVLWCPWSLPWGRALQGCHSSGKSDRLHQSLS
jgi:hypothetical protein